MRQYDYENATVSSSLVCELKKKIVKNLTYQQLRPLHPSCCEIADHACVWRSSVSSSTARLWTHMFQLCRSKDSALINVKTPLSETTGFELSLRQTRSRRALKPS